VIVCGGERKEETAAAFPPLAAQQVVPEEEDRQAEPDAQCGPETLAIVEEAATPISTAWPLSGASAGGDDIANPTFGDLGSNVKAKFA